MAEHAGGGDDDVEELREQDRFLPIANISRLVKKRLPYNAKVAKDAKETTQVSARFLVGTSNEAATLRGPELPCCGSPAHLELLGSRYRCCIFVVALFVASCDAIEVPLLLFIYRGSWSQFFVTLVATDEP